MRKKGKSAHWVLRSMAISGRQLAALVFVWTICIIGAAAGIVCLVGIDEIHAAASRSATTASAYLQSQSSGIPSSLILGLVLGSIVTFFVMRIYRVNSNISDMKNFRSTDKTEE